MVIRIELSILGLPVALSCDGTAEAESLRKACQQFVGRCTCESPELHIYLRSDPVPGPCQEPELKAEGQRLALTGPSANGFAFATLRSGWCGLDPRHFDDPAALMAEVIEPMVLFIATRNGRVPLHAAAIQLDGVAVLLAGPSGSGKSSLALAADRAGLRVLSEDMVFVQLEPHLALWGWGSHAHLFPADTKGRKGPVRIRNGKRKIAVPIASMVGDVPVRDVALCLLEHGSKVALKRITSGEALARMSAPEEGFDLLGDEILQASRRLIGDGAWVLTLSADADEAVKLLGRNSRQICATSLLR